VSEPDTMMWRTLTNILYRIESPPKQSVTSSMKPSPLAPPRGFRPINPPIQPRSVLDRDPPDMTGPNSTSDTKRAQIEDSVKDPHPVVVLEEEQDPEKVLEERRKKREEIMAKFRAGAKPAASVTAEIKEAAGPGADSVTSTGIKTGMRTGLSASGKPSLRAG
jgi:hypothetical protein